MFTTKSTKECTAYPYHELLLNNYSKNALVKSDTHKAKSYPAFGNAKHKQ
jgi:hypothetical protein